MALDTLIETDVSSLIEAQFPAYYRDEGPVLVEFVKTYYRWLESSNNVLFHSRRLPSYLDIDTTLDDFVVHFKRTYLNNIQLETTSNVRQLVKHSLDIYRSRGSERAIDLLFRLVFGVGASVYLPSRDILRLSSAEWVRPVYLETSPREDLDKFVGRQVVGMTSGAVGFVERLVRRKSPDKFIDLLYISAVRGDFQTGEIINASTDPFPVLECPRIVGSLTSLFVSDGGANYEVGDIVRLTGVQGYRGLGRVVEVESETGKVIFTLVDGGYGYTSNSQALVSEKVLFLTDVEPWDEWLRPYYVDLFEQVVQPLANIHYLNATGSFVPEDFIYTYYGNGSVMGSGQVISVAETNSTAGELFVSVVGNLDNTIYTTANAVAANLAVSNGYSDKSATGNVISQSTTMTLAINAISGSLAVGEEVYQNAVMGYANGLVKTSSLSALVVTGVYGVFRTGERITGRTFGGSANVEGVSLTVGVISTNNVFTNSSLAPLHTMVSNTTALLSVTSNGTGAAFAVSADLLYDEVVVLNTDLIANYAPLALNVNWPFPDLPTSNLLSLIDDSLHEIAANVGKLQLITTTARGEGYTSAPMARVHEPLTVIFRGHDWKLEVTDSGSFQAGEVVTQSSTGARGLVSESNSSVLYCERLSLLKDFEVTTNTAGLVVGTSSGAEANVVHARADDRKLPLDTSGELTGVDAVVTANVIVSEGTITTEGIEVIDSGFGYLDDETIIFSGTEMQTSGVAHAVLGRQGVGSGYHRTKDGFLSNTKKLPDGHYYQTFSYEVRASVTLDRYKDMLREILHVAGTRAFGAYWHKAKANAVVGSVGASITTGASDGPMLDFSDPADSFYLGG